MVFLQAVVGPVEAVRGGPAAQLVMLVAGLLLGLMAVKPDAPFGAGADDLCRALVVDVA